MILLFLWDGCQKTSTVATQRGSSRDMYPDQESWESTIIISRNERLVALADSRKMVKFNKQNIAHLVGDVNVDFYDEDGTHVSRLLADSAQVNFKANQMSAFGNILVESDSGLVLKTETLSWDDQYDMVVTQDSVMFSTAGGDTLYGIGFESDVDLTHWKIYRPWGVTERQVDAVD